MRVAIHIDTLVLNGVGRLDGAEFEATLREQLQAHIEAHGWPTAWGRSTDVQSMTAAYPPGNLDAATAGGQVAELLTEGARS